MLQDSIYKRYVPAVVFPYECTANNRYFIFSGNKLLVKLEGSQIEAPLQESPEELGVTVIRRQYLGVLDGQHCCSVEIDENAGIPQGYEYRDLRSIFGQVEDDIFLLAGRAFQIVDWDRNHLYCGRCGTATGTKQDERAKACPKCGLICYPKLSPAVIVAVVREGRLLLAHAKHFRPDFYSVIAGFVEPGETFEECVKREVMEEVGIRVGSIKYFGSQPWPFPNSLMVAFTAEYEGGEIQVDGVEITDAGWYREDEFPETPTKMSIAGRLVDWYRKNF